MAHPITTHDEEQKYTMHLFQSRFVIVYSRKRGVCVFLKQTSELTPKERKKKFYHEHVSEARMTDIMTDSSNIDREQINVGKTRNQRIGCDLLIWFPHSLVWIEEYGWGRDHARGRQERVSSLQNVQCMSKVMIRIRRSVNLT